MLNSMTDEFLHTCRDELNEIATEIAMLEDGQMVSGSEEKRVLRIRTLRRVRSRLEALIDELETAGTA